jgi:LacI family transcriptional regulator
MESRVTVRDIAKQAKVHFTTVSMALRNHPEISAATRERIKKVAKEMGYRPDAMLSALSSYRQGLRKPHYQATIAWINAYPKREEFYILPLYLEFFHGARERAEEMGFKLEEFWLGEPGLTRARLRGILQSRGIRGALVAPMPPYGETEKMELVPWERLSAVSLGFSLRRPQLHTVSPNQYHAMRTILREIRKLGYRRIGFVAEQDGDLRCDHNWQAAFWVDYHSQPPQRRVEPLWLPPGSVSAADLRNWIETQRPDVITPDAWKVRDLVRKLGIKVPRDIGLVSHSISSGDNVFSGIDEMGPQVGAAALEYVVAMLNQQEYGIPDVPKQLLIEGRWVRGTTVRRVGPSLVSDAESAESRPGRVSSRRREET